ncbi:helix-turn-helix domain-containing protein [Thermochromatium tepidum]|jgi:Probable transposase.|uniref:helix-turn-helix domain-containing protein n=1 Tax=Thermochromatium tepidum TaxID=1050 RepID=UPI001B880EE1|nr:helix-turn-helix domain-containing protein [Thermochromatium tepidum]
MQRHQAFKYELIPNGQQERQMRRFAGACRFVFNKALVSQKERYERGEKKLGYAGLSKLLTEWRHGEETAWLADAPVHPLQRALLAGCQSCETKGRTWQTLLPGCWLVPMSARMACGSNRVGGRKQEPTEAIQV